MAHLRVERPVTVVVLFAVLIVCTQLPASANGPTYTFTASEGYYNGNALYYLMTDVSDQTYATTWGVNYTPLLRNALTLSGLPNVFYVTNNPQNLVFSTEWKTRYASSSYVPVWRLWTVTWKVGATPTELTSYAAIKSAKDSGQLTMGLTQIVVAASIIINTYGIAMEQATVTDVPPDKQIELPLRDVYANGLIYTVLSLDFSLKSAAQALGANYAPNLAKFRVLRLYNRPAPWQNRYVLYPCYEPDQLPIITQLPYPIYPVNPNPAYSPLMEDFTVKVCCLPPRLYTSYADLVTAGARICPTDYYSYQPITIVPGG